MRGYIKRIMGTVFAEDESIWTRYESLALSDLPHLIRSLEQAVSLGYFGVAAELSDRLTHGAGIKIRKRPKLCIRLEVERMKRYSYMGYRKLTVATAKSLRILLQENCKKLSPAEFNLWLFTANGFEFWNSPIQRRLARLIDMNEKIVKEHACNRVVNIELESFSCAMRGRFHAINGESRLSKIEHLTAIDLADQHGLLRSQAHQEVLFVESLAINGNWPAVVEHGMHFLDRALMFDLRSHLLLRSIVLLLQAPDGALSEGARRDLVFKFVCLIYASGLSESKPMIPYVDKLLRDIDTPDILRFDVMPYNVYNTLRTWLSSLGWRQFEKIVEIYYREMGYEVVVLPEGFPAFDLIAYKRDIDGTTISRAIQCKNWSGKVRKSAVPGIETMDSALQMLKKMPQQPPPSTFILYAKSGATSQAVRACTVTLQKCMGDYAAAEVRDIDSITSGIVALGKDLLRIVFSVETARS